MYRLTARRQNVTVMTVNTLRTELESLSNGARKFTLAKVERDRVTVGCDYLTSGKKQHSLLVLPAYPTGWRDDGPCNNLNVVLDPLGFNGIQSCEERNVFAPLLGHDVLQHYHNLHPDATMPYARCCC